MEEIFFAVFPIFAIIFIGKIVKHKWISSEEFWRGHEKISYFMLFPAVMFNYITQTTFSSGELTRLLICLMIIISIISFVVIYIQEKYTKEDPRLFTSLFQGSVRYNNYLFLGISASLYGDSGLEIAAAITGYMIIFTNIISILVFNHYVEKRKYENAFEAILDLLKKFALNPLIISSIAGFAFNHSGIEMNLAVRKILTILSDSALAMSLMCLGAEIKLKINEKDLMPIIRACLIKLIFMPIVAYCVLTLMNVSGMPKAVAILFCSLPCASTSYVLARQMGGDTKSITSIITLSIILGVFTIPAVIRLFV
jgi:malonate transporter